jgi:hypothetical protein
VLLQTDPGESMPVGEASAVGAKDAFGGELQKLIDRLREAKDLVDPGAPSIESIFNPDLTERPKKTKPKETTAKHVALKCWDAFTDLAGKNAAVATTTDGVAYGPFLEFVKHTFIALDLGASAENWAKAAVRTRKSEEE